MSRQFRRDLVSLVPRLRRFAYSLTGNRHDADDLVQVACEKALAREEQFRPGTRMDSWMYRIIQNQWLDERRKSAVRGHGIPAEEIEISDGGKAASSPEARMMLGHVRAAMVSLPKEQRAVLALVAIEGLSYREAAETLEIPVGTVMSRLSRAREKLMPLIAEDRRIH